MTAVICVAALYISSQSSLMLHMFFRMDFGLIILEVIWYFIIVQLDIATVMLTWTTVAYQFTQWAMKVYSVLVIEKVQTTRITISLINNLYVRTIKIWYNSTATWWLHIVSWVKTHWWTTNSHGFHQRTIETNPQAWTYGTRLVTSFLYSPLYYNYQYCIIYS